jgi:hypothetical protein
MAKMALSPKPVDNFVEALGSSLQGPREICPAVKLAKFSATERATENQSLAVGCLPGGTVFARHIDAPARGCA